MKDENIPIENIKHTKVFIVIVKNYLNGEFIEVPYNENIIVTAPASAQ